MIQFMHNQRRLFVLGIAIGVTATLGMALAIVLFG